MRTRSHVWPVVAVTAQSTSRGKRGPRDEGRRGNDGAVAGYLVQEREPRERRGGRSEGNVHPTAGQDPVLQLQSCFYLVAWVIPWGTHAAWVPWPSCYSTAFGPHRSQVQAPAFRGVHGPGAVALTSPALALTSPWRDYGNEALAHVIGVVTDPAMQGGSKLWKNALFTNTEAALGRSQNKHCFLPLPTIAQTPQELQGSLPFSLHKEQNIFKKNGSIWLNIK